MVKVEPQSCKLPEEAHPLHQQDHLHPHHSQVGQVQAAPHPALLHNLPLSFLELEEVHHRRLHPNQLNW
ncbi:unnamed protein product [Clavelina lepadiformis]|uniref:Uncharacterized protein n=1 Tax=Clavelina lepadiformis TaxID=159417 RepID=A0ABP0FYZ3_CLALP